MKPYALGPPQKPMLNFQVISRGIAMTTLDLWNQVQVPLTWLYKVDLNVSNFQQVFMTMQTYSDVHSFPVNEVIVY